MTSPGRHRRPRPPLIVALAAVAVLALGLRFAIPLVVDGVGAALGSGSATVVPTPVHPGGRAGSSAGSR